MTRAEAFKYYIHQSSRPIVVGPWTSEVGTEALYWVPWLRWLLEGLPEDRIHVIARGGSGCWYPAKHVLDLYDMRDLEVVRLHQHEQQIQHKTIKQVADTPFDRRVVGDACDQWAISHPICVHPAQLHVALQDWWALRIPFPRILEWTRYTKLHNTPEGPREGFWSLPTPDHGLDLPERYYCIRMYARNTLQFSGALPDLVFRLVRGLTERAPVVVLTNPHHTDDHIDLEWDDIAKAVPVTVVKSPVQETLRMQSALIARSCGLVTLYGGIQQLGLMCGVPTLGLYDHLQGTFDCHHLLSHFLSSRLGVPFTTVPTSVLGVWASAMAQLSSRAVPPPAE